MISGLLIAGVVYVALGVLFSMVFLWRGLSRVDAGAKGSSWAFKLILIPGLTALWPVMARVWMRAGPPGKEHR